MIFVSVLILFNTEAIASIVYGSKRLNISDTVFTLSIAIISLMHVRFIDTLVRLTGKSNTSIIGNLFSFSCQVVLMFIAYVYSFSFSITILCLVISQLVYSLIMILVACSIIKVPFFKVN